MAFPTLTLLILTGFFAIQPHSPTAYSKQVVPERKHFLLGWLRLGKTLDVLLTLVRSAGAVDSSGAQLQVSLQHHLSAPPFHCGLMSESVAEQAHQ